MFKYAIYTLLACMFITVEGFTQEVPLFISPQRLVLEDGQRTTSINLTNKSDRTRKYKILLVDQKMNETGTTEIVDTFPFSAKRMLRYQPGNVTIAPGQRQIIRVQVRVPQTLTPGDYHTHLLFEEEQIINETTNTDVGENQFAIDIGTTYGLAIPVVVQKGQQTGALKINSGHIDAPNIRARSLRLNVTRTGNSEAVAHVEATHTHNGVTEPIITPRNVRLYREVDTANIAVPLLADVIGKDLGPITVTVKRNQEKNAEILNTFTVN